MKQQLAEFLDGEYGLTKGQWLKLIRNSKFSDVCIDMREVLKLSSVNHENNYQTRTGN